MSTALSSFMIIDSLSALLCAAELGEPVDLDRTSPEIVADFLASVPHLRMNVPYAAFRLVSLLCGHHQHEVRMAAVQALPMFVDIYPTDVEELLLKRAADASRKVRQACAESLAVLLQVSDEQRLSSRFVGSERARGVLTAAKRRPRLVA